jgi:parallel beta-helix repeat protein
LFNYYGLGVFKSTNGGLNWSGGYNTGLPKMTFCYKILVNPDYDHRNVVYLAEQTGLYISRDSGETWSKYIFDPDKAGKSCSDVVTSSDGKKVYVIGGYNSMYQPLPHDGIGYWLSTDYGVSFTKININGFPDQRTQLTISKENDAYLYGVTNTGGNVVVYISSDSGKSFPDTTVLGQSSGSMASDFLFIEASPHNHLVSFAGYGNGRTNNCLYRISNGWNYSNSIYTAVASDYNCFAFNPSINSQDSTQAILGADQGIRFSIDSGLNWTDVSNTLYISQTFRVTSDISNPDKIMIAVTDGGFSRTTDGGFTWNDKDVIYDGTNILYSKLDPYHTHIIGSKGMYDSVTSGNPNPNIRYSTDGGSYWCFNRSDIIGFWDGNEDWIAAITEDPYIPGIFFCPIRNILPNNNYININITTNYGANWESNSANQHYYFKPIYTNNFCESPQHFSMSKSDTSVIYISTINFGDSACQNKGSNIYKTINAGHNWTDLNIKNKGIPNRYISSVNTDLTNTNIVYLTLSGFNDNTPNNPGHVFKTTNGGTNWFDISGSLQGNGLVDAPVNFMILRYVSCTEKELIVATDAGVYRSSDNGNFQWQELAQGLPASIAMGMDYNIYSGKLRLSTFGRSVYEVNISSNPVVPIYIHNLQILTQDPSTSGINIANDIVICSGATLKIPISCTIKMATGKKIIIMDGGQIDASSGQAITFTSQSGMWGGIEIQGNYSFANLKNITFNNTQTPIIVNGSTNTNLPNSISISYCTFNVPAGTSNDPAPVSISNRPNVTVYSSNFNTTSGCSLPVCGISAVGSDYLNLSSNEIHNLWNCENSTGISVYQSSYVSLNGNKISDIETGILMSSSTGNIVYNTIACTTNAMQTGIQLNGCTNSIVYYNNIRNCIDGIKLSNYSSPEMLENDVILSDYSGNALYCDNTSSPRLTPTIQNEEIIWDAGQNILESTNGGVGINVNNNSVPNIDFGYNTIVGTFKHLYGSGFPYLEWPAECNSWGGIPYPSNFDVSNYSYQTTTILCLLYDCQIPGGGGIMGSGLLEEYPPDPPQPIIVNYGGGVYDTLIVSNTARQVSADKSLYSLGDKQIMLGNYQNGFNIFKQVIQNYQDSLVAIKSLDRLMYCNLRMNVDTNGYNELRNYYINLVSNNSTDTAFSKSASELSRKCLVMIRELVPAINEYEYVIAHTNDSADILSAEINIIEAYMLMHQGGGNTVQFTGNLAYLKPMSIKDGIRMIHDKLLKHKTITHKVEIPREFMLYQNYPNPFNPYTTIKYSLPTNEKVTIKIYDILGRLVTTLVNEFKKAGYYDVKFDGTNYASGVYFYRIDAGKYVDSKKMILVK